MPRSDGAVIGGPSLLIDSSEKQLTRWQAIYTGELRDVLCKFTPLRHRPRQICVYFIVSPSFRITEATLGETLFSKAEISLCQRIQNSRLSPNYSSNCR